MTGQILLIEMVEVDTLKRLFEKVFGTYSEREIRKLDSTVHQIEALESEYAQLTDEQLKSKTEQFKERLRKGEP